MKYVFNLVYPTTIYWLFIYSLIFGLLYLACLVLLKSFDKEDKSVIFGILRKLGFGDRSILRRII